MIGQEGGAACHHTCAYKRNYTDHCFNNTIVQATKTSSSAHGLTDPFAIIWFCNADNLTKIMPDYVSILAADTVGIADSVVDALLCSANTLAAVTI